MSSLDAPAPRRRLGAPKTILPGAIFLGAAAGAGWVGVADALHRLFGSSTSTIVSLGLATIA